MWKETDELNQISVVKNFSNLYFDGLPGLSPGKDEELFIIYLQKHN